MPPTHLAQVLVQAKAAFQAQEEIRRELVELKQLLLASRTSELKGSREITTTLNAHGDQLQKVSASVAVNAELSRRLDSAFDFQLGTLSSLGSRIEALEETARRPWSVRCFLALTGAWHQASRDARLITSNDWEAYRRAAQNGGQLYRWLWLLTVGAMATGAIFDLLARWI